jgi:hypothetical protein
MRRRGEPFSGKTMPDKNKLKERFLHYFNYQISARRWCYVLCITLFLIIGGAALLVYIVDPCYRYRLPKFYDTVYYEIYSTGPRLIKESDYDLFMLGSSMCRNYFLDDIDRSLGCHSLKFAAAGATAYDLKKFADMAIEAKGEKLKRIVYSFDIYSLNKTQPHWKNVDYMYRDDHKEDYRYLFARDTYSNMHFLLKRKMRPKGKRKYQTVKNRMFSTEHEKTVYSHDVVAKTAKQYYGMHHSMTPYRKGSEETFAKTLLALVDKNPGIEFTVFLPPYHIYSYCMSEIFGEADALIRLRSKVLCELLKRKNVKLFDFQYIPEFACDSAYYTDIQHFSSALARKILTSLATGKHQLHTEADVLKTEKALRQLIADHMARYRYDVGAATKGKD